VPLSLLWPWAALALGLVVGSFANVCIHRLPLGRSVVWPRSRCPRCGAGIRPWDNLPVLSYLFLLGRCRDCRAAISPRYPLVEAANGALYFTLASACGPSPRALAAMVFATALLVLTLTDYDHQLLPDAITLPAIPLGLAAAFLPGPPLAPSPLAALAAAVAGYALLFGLGWAWERVRGFEALGGGDPKMVAMLGAFLGPQKTLLAVFMASLAGTVVGLAFILIARRDFGQKLPLGSFLGLAGLAALLAGDPVVAWYRGLLHG
jgi:leader peptidase (prepilin peptidase)/N-methyltransferase